MSNPQTVSISNPYAVRSRKLTAALKAAKRKGDEDRLVALELEQRRNDFESSAYFDNQGFFLPDTVILACLKEAARTLRKGKDIDRAVLLSDDTIRIHNRTSIPFTSIDAVFENPAFRLETPCRVPPKTGVLIWKCRCMMPTGWSITFSVEYSEDLIVDKTLVDISSLAGALVGLGGWRPKFGRFSSEVVS